MYAHLQLLLAVLPTPGASLQQPKPPDRPIHPMPAEPVPEAPPISLMELARTDVVLETAATGSPTETSTGKVADLVISTQDGQLVCAALAVGKILGGDERIVLVPATAYKFAAVDKKPALVLRLTKAELSALPEFDVKKDGKEGLDRAVERARGLGMGTGASGIRPRDAKDPKDPKESNKQGAEDKESRYAADGPAYVLALHLPECSVGANDAEFGNVHDAAVDPSKYTVTYFVVSRSGGASSGPTMHVVPFRVCTWDAAAGKIQIKVDKPSEQMKAAPTYKKPDAGILTSEQMKAADAFFGVTRTRETEGTRPL